MNTVVRLLVVLAWSGISVRAAAQSPLVVRNIGAVVARTEMSFVDGNSTLSVRPLSDGRVLVTDVKRRVVWMFDANLGNPRAILDSVPGKANSFPASGGALVAGRADTTLCLDGASRALIVILPDGRTATTRPRPLPVGLNNVPQSINRPGQAVDLAEFGLVFGLLSAIPRPPQRPAGARDTTVGVGTGELLLAQRLVGGPVDSLAFLFDGLTMTFAFKSEEWTTLAYSSAPFPFHDEWTAMADGSLAVVRGRDYHVDWIRPDGSRSASPSLPHPSSRLTDAARRVLADSVNVAARARFERNKARRDSTARAQGLDPSRPAALPRALQIPEAVVVDAQTIPELLPPMMRFGGGGLVALGDADNNLWIRVRNGEASATTPIYDVVSRSGVLIDRVRLPAGRVLVGFGAGGVAYMRATDAGQHWIEKARIR